MGIASLNPSFYDFCQVRFAKPSPSRVCAAIIGSVGVKGGLARRSVPLMPTEPKYTSIKCDVLRRRRRTLTTGLTPFAALAPSCASNHNISYFLKPAVVIVGGSKPRHLLSAKLTFGRILHALCAQVTVIQSRPIY